MDTLTEVFAAAFASPASFVGLVIMVALIVFVLRGLLGWYQDARDSGDKRSPLRGIVAVMTVSWMVFGTFYLIFFADIGFLLTFGLLIISWGIFLIVIHGYVFPPKGVEANNEKP